MGKMSAFLFALLGLSLLPLRGQDWERIKADPSVIWGEGWGASVEEADREALASLASRIAVGVAGEFRSVEEQRTTSSGTEYTSLRRSRVELVTNATLRNTGRTVLKGGRRAHVGRWIRRSELDAVFAAREQRISDLVRCAGAAEEECRAGDALRCYWWAYVLLRSLPRPSELRDVDGRMLLNAIPDRMNGVLGDISVSAAKAGGRLLLSFRFRGLQVQDLAFSCFDGAGWSPRTEVRGGRAEVELAPGALGEIVQLKIEYEYRNEALMDEELSGLVSAQDSRMLKKALVIFRRQKPYDGGAYAAQ